MSPLLSLYLGFSRVSGPIWRIALRRRLARGKETPERVAEKLGVPPRARPGGRVIWFHALSVGESLALIPLIETALSEMPGAHVLLTTSTATSAAALARAGLPERAIHVLQPIDTARAVGRFLDHWRPDVAAFAELDFWPRLMVETHRRGIPMLLINSRLPEGNFRRRKRLGGVTREVLRFFEVLLVQDEASVGRFAALGADPGKIRVAGALKAAARPLPADAGELERFGGQIGARPVWLAAATWGSEHAVIAEAHRLVLERLPEALLILAPRHIRDADGAEAALAPLGPVARRSRGETIKPENRTYVADTMGEMGLWYRLAPVSFVGHSLTVAGADLEGKNPFEAAALGSAILHGPEVSYFAESYAALMAEGAAREVTGAESLGGEVLALQNAGARAEMVAGAERVVAAGRGVVEETWAAVRGAIPS